MNASFSLTGKLSDEQREAIKIALRTQRIEMSDEAFFRLCLRIEDVCVTYIRAKRMKPAKSEAETRKEIKKLLRVLENLSITAFRVLSETSTVTPTYELLKEFAETTDALLQNENCLDFHNKRYAPAILAYLRQWVCRGSDDFDCGRFAPKESNLYQIPDTLPSMAHSLLLEACRMALSKKPPARIKGLFIPISDSDDKNDSVFGPNVVRGGRPKKIQERKLVLRLACVFKEATGRRVTASPSGAFDEFLSACLKVVNLKVGAETNRKLIWAALHLPTGHFPKPRKKK